MIIALPRFVLELDYSDFTWGYYSTQFFYPIHFWTAENSLYLFLIPDSFFSFLFSTGLFTAIRGLKLLKIDTRVLSPSRLYQALTGEGHFIQLLFRIEDLPFSPAVRSAFLDIEKEAKRRKTWGTADVWSKSSKAYHGPSLNARTWWVWWV